MYNWTFFLRSLPLVFFFYIIALHLVHSPPVFGLHFIFPYSCFNDRKKIRTVVIYLIIFFPFFFPLFFSYTDTGTERRKRSFCLCLGFFALVFFCTLAFFGLFWPHLVCM